jgi:hypothetical protein
MWRSHKHCHDPYLGEAFPSHPQQPLFGINPFNRGHHLGNVRNIRHSDLGWENATGAIGRA